MTITLRNIGGIVVVIAFICLLISLNRRWQLGAAVSQGDLRAIQYYCDHGVNVNSRDMIANVTPLRRAIDSDQLDAFELLLQLGASPDAAGRDGLSATDLAASMGDKKWLQLALANGADPNRFNDAPGFNAGTPLYFAIRKGRRRNVVTLLDNGADPDIAVDSSGATALTRASAFAQWSIVILLLERGADVHAGPPGGSFIESLRQRDFSNHLVEFNTVRNLLGSEYDPSIVFKDTYLGRDSEGKPVYTPPDPQ